MNERIPPLGIAASQETWLEVRPEQTEHDKRERILDLRAALRRYRAAAIDPPPEWEIELCGLLEAETERLTQVVEMLRVELAAKGSPVEDATTEALRDELRDRGWTVKLS
jgi:hypothetical protein